MLKRKKICLRCNGKGHTVLNFGFGAVDKEIECYECNGTGKI